MSSGRSCAISAPDEGGQKSGGSSSNCDLIYPDVS